jgi:hypothetical protein
MSYGFLTVSVADDENGQPVEKQPVETWVTPVLKPRVALSPGASVDVPIPLTLLTFCVLVLRNGYTVHGVSACASPENFNAELGRRIARENAVREMWPLMGYALRDKLHNELLPQVDG